MSRNLILDFREIDRAHAPLVGGKGALLAELSRIEDARTPPGFVVTTAAFRQIMSQASSIEGSLDQLSRLTPDDSDAIRELSAEIRQAIGDIPTPADLEKAITGALGRLGEHAAYAVRSSATAEDLPTASFAGQHDTFLNVVGPAAILQHVSRCWASLYTERAVTYRLRNGFDHRRVSMAVVVQRMVFPLASGVLFTADPVSGNRKVSVVEATFGLGEALVSGQVNADTWHVRDARVISSAIASKLLAIVASPTGGIVEQPVDAARQQQPVLTDAQVVRLEELGRRIEGHFARPQDIEWCLVDDDFLIVQSRPVTTLFPIPVANDGANHVYVSVGHQQMMTDAMKPLGISMWQLTGGTTFHEAGGRLFVDITENLASPATRAGIVSLLGKDPLIGDALRTILDRGDFIRTVPDDGPARAHPADPAATAPLDPDPALVSELIDRVNVSVAALERDIEDKSGPALFDFILADLQELKRILFDPQSRRVIMSGMGATWWLNDQLEAWLGEKNAADTLAQSVPNNVTSEMGLALLDVADAIRPYPDVVRFLEQVADDDFLTGLSTLEGGRVARDAIVAFLDRYGMRCVGEIDITRPRWSEHPRALLPMVLGNIRNFAPGEAARRFERGRQEALKKEQELLARLRALPDGEQKAGEAKRMIDRLRAFIGYREYPKYGMVSRYRVYKRALMREAERLARAGVVGEEEDVFFLTFPELHDVARTNRADPALIRQRRDAFRSYQTLSPPRVLTSEGENVAGSYRREDLPAGALVGVPVSAGTVEGRARVILDVENANLEAGDILVTRYTDPSWTPLFVAIKGLVTEVGGLMTHGAVIAREYGLPAVVGVERATRLIRDGQRIRVNGVDGYVEILGI
ncbi:MAG TPA: rifamycin-inactivating phosphotransferase [Gemmatimonadaceae bacterium]